MAVQSSIPTLSLSTKSNLPRQPSSRLRAKSICFTHLANQNTTNANITTGLGDLFVAAYAYTAGPGRWQRRWEMGDGESRVRDERKEWNGNDGSPCSLGNVERLGVASPGVAYCVVGSLLPTNVNDEVTTDDSLTPSSASSPLPSSLFWFR
jgi:hypothetical protein